MSISENIFNAIKTLIESRAAKEHTHSKNDISNFPEIPTVPELATVATSGSYNDLIGTPTIPEDISGELESLRDKLAALLEEMSDTIGDAILQKRFAINGNAAWYVTPNGDLYGCGSNYFGQQGNGEKSSSTSMYDWPPDLSKNVLTFTKRAENVKSVYCQFEYTGFSGQNVTWYITNDGDLYGCGCGQFLGIESGEDVLTFTKRAENVEKFCMYEDALNYQNMSSYITTDGDLYHLTSSGFVKSAENISEIIDGWYITKDGELFDSENTKLGENVARFYHLNNDIIWYITKDDELYCRDSTGSHGKCAENVAEAYFYFDSGWYITKNKELFGYYGARGVIENLSSITKYADNVEKFYGNDMSAWYINKDNELFGRGSNSSGQQGSGDTNNVESFTKRADNVDKVFVSWDSNVPWDNNVTWYITKDGDLYGCGSNDNGQQGSGDTENILTFTKRAENVASVCSCNWHDTYAEVYEWSTTYYISNDGELYACGNNAYGSIGTGNTNITTTFTKVVSM